MSTTNELDIPCTESLKTLSPQWAEPSEADRAPTASTRGWTRRKFKRMDRHAADGYAVADGYTRGLFGIDQRGRDRWRVTHLPTGFGLGTFKRLRTAQRYCSLVEQYFTADGMAYAIDAARRINERWERADRQDKLSP